MLAAGLVASNIIGSGIFLLPATLAQIGSISVIGWLISTVGAFATTAVFARLGAISASTDGMVGYVERSLGRFAGFATALIYWMGAWVGVVAMAVAVAGCAAAFAPSLAKPTALGAVAVVAIALATVVNLAGARSAARLSAASLVAGLIPIVAIAAFGWAWFEPRIFLASWNVAGGSAAHAVARSMISVFWAYTGFESAAVASAIVRDPRRNVPIATYAGTAVAAVVYIAASSVVMGLVPARELALSTAPFALAASRMLGPGAGVAVALCALIKTSGTLCGWVLVVAQAARAGANRYFLPGRAPGGGGRPWRILLAMAAVMSVAALASISPTLGRQFGVLIAVSTVWTVIPYALCCVALWRLARGRLAERAVAAFALAFNLWLLTTSDQPTALLTGGLIVAVVAGWLTLVRRQVARA